MVTGTAEGIAPTPIGGTDRGRGRSPGAGKSAHAYERLRDGLRSGRWRPGHRLVITSIAEELGMSTVPVREAIRRLEAEGRVTFERNVGARAALAEEEEHGHAVQRLALVEGLATATAARRLDRRHLDRARAVDARLRAALRSGEPAVAGALEVAFHAALYEQCPDPRLVELVHRAWERVPDASWPAADRLRAAVGDHGALLGLVAAGARPLDIELAVRDHRRRAMQDPGRPRREEP